MAFKTKLPKAITSVDEAKKYLRELAKNGEAYHPDDPAQDIAWGCDKPTEGQMKRLNKLMNDILSLKEVENNYEFDPYGFILGEWHTFEIISVRGKEKTVTENQLIDMLTEKGSTDVLAWIKAGTDDGDHFLDRKNDIKYIKIS